MGKIYKWMGDKSPKKLKLVEKYQVLNEVMPFIPCAHLK